MKLAKINNLLLGLIILVNAYIIVAPLLPIVAFHLDNRGNRRQQLQAKVHPSPKSSAAATTPQPNQVIVPAMLLDQPILEGPTSQAYKVLDQGIWRWPHSSTPDKGGNTVLIGHRFTYTNPRGVFYYLDRVHPGDEIGVIWNHTTYTYRVVTTQIVPPTDVSIENTTSNSELTLFTCTPLWLPKNRLVIVANLEARP